MIPMGYQSQQRTMQRTYSQIDLNDRRKLARWRGMGLSVDVIAERLGRHRSTILGELRRNAFIDKDWPELNGSIA